MVTAIQLQTQGRLMMMMLMMIMRLQLVIPLMNKTHKVGNSTLLEPTFSVLMTGA